MNHPNPITAKQCHVEHMFGGLEIENENVNSDNSEKTVQQNTDAATNTPSKNKTPLAKLKEIAVDTIKRTLNPSEPMPNKKKNNKNDDKQKTEVSGYDPHKKSHGKRSDDDDDDYKNKLQLDTEEDVLLVKQIRQVVQQEPVEEPSLLQSSDFQNTKEEATKLKSRRTQEEINAKKEVIKSKEDAEEAKKETKKAKKEAEKAKKEAKRSKKETEKAKKKAIKEIQKVKEEAHKNKENQVNEAKDKICFKYTNAVFISIIVLVIFVLSAISRKGMCRFTEGDNLFITILKNVANTITIGGLGFVMYFVKPKDCASGQLQENK